jgi:hypothetical protein
MLVSTSSCCRRSMPRLLLSVQVMLAVVSMVHGSAATDAGTTQPLIRSAMAVCSTRPLAEAAAGHRSAAGRGG